MVAEASASIKRLSSEQSQVPELVIASEAKQSSFGSAKEAGLLRRYRSSQ
jgi:hypothetical protein